MKMVGNKKKLLLLFFPIGCFLCSCTSQPSEYQKKLLNSEYNEHKITVESDRDKICLDHNVNNESEGVIASYLVLFGAALTGAKNGAIGSDFKSMPSQKKCVKQFKD